MKRQHKKVYKFSARDIMPATRIVDSETPAFPPVANSVVNIVGNGTVYGSTMPPMNPCAMESSARVEPRCCLDPREGSIYLAEVTTDYWNSLLPLFSHEEQLRTLHAMLPPHVQARQCSLEHPFR
jgi:hypothetical protein